MQTIQTRAAKIRLLICDVDGVMTNGHLYMGNNGEELKAFHIHDGLGLKLLLKVGIEVAVITAKQTHIVENRMKALGIKYLYQGQENKVSAYQDLKTKLNLDDDEIAYIGDDLPDIAVMRKVGFAIAVANAVTLVKENAHHITILKGGKGAVREVCELILNAQNLDKKAYEDYLIK